MWVNDVGLDLQEFMLAIDVTSSGTPEEKLKWAFRIYDVDGNGVIDIQEMEKIVQVSVFSFSTPSSFFNLWKILRKISNNHF